MLMISRRIGERICIGDDVEVVVKEIHRRHVKLALKAGPRQLILRGELHDAIHAANSMAAATPGDICLPSAIPAAIPGATPAVAASAVAVVSVARTPHDSDAP
jgi:carbon storage regulator